MSNELETMQNAENILSPLRGGDVALTPIVEAVLDAGNALNIVNLLRLSCDLNNASAQASYLSVISECAKIFSTKIDEISELQSAFSDEGTYYYTDFLLSVFDDCKVSQAHIENLKVFDGDLAFTNYLKLRDLVDR